MHHARVADSAHEDKRSELIPINRRYPLAEILPLVDAIPTGKKRFVTYEYVMIHEFNDTEAEAHATGSLLQGKKAYINLIPFNSPLALRIRWLVLRFILRTQCEGLLAYFRQIHAGIIEQQNGLEIVFVHSIAVPISHGQ